MVPAYRFAPASANENIVFGAQRPGYPSERVDTNAVRTWLAHLQENSVERICCLLTSEQLAYYDVDLLAEYRTVLGPENVCHAPIADFKLSSEATLREGILPFLIEADERDARVVVHCSGGLGRTGHILAAWLSTARGVAPEEALQEVEKMYRDPLEAVRAGNASLEQLLSLLASDRA